MSSGEAVRATMPSVIILVEGGAVGKDYLSEEIRACACECACDGACYECNDCVDEGPHCAC